MAQNKWGCDLIDLDLIYRGDCLPCQNRKLVQDKTEKGSGGGLFTEMNLRQTGRSHAHAQKGNCATKWGAPEMGRILYQVATPQANLYERMLASWVGIE